jgi:hypothetical protein
VLHSSTASTGGHHSSTKSTNASSVVMVSMNPLSPFSRARSPATWLHRASTSAAGARV